MCCGKCGLCLCAHANFAGLNPNALKHVPTNSVHPCDPIGQKVKGPMIDFYSDSGRPSRYLACEEEATIGHGFNKRLHVCVQEKKQLIFEGTVGKDAEALGRLTAEDLRFLFG